jgi:hypothetical protein
MNKLYIAPTALTPLIDFDPANGVMKIKGRSIPDSPDEFWFKVLSWFESYLMDPNAETTFDIDLEYFNVTSSKRILALLYKLNELSDGGNEVGVNWHYREGDEDMYEVGQDYAYMVKVPFEFKAYEESDLALAI